MNIEDKPNELIVDKACALWAEMISDPKFNTLGNSGVNSDPSGAVGMAQLMAGMLADKEKASDENLQRFTETLKKYLINKCSYDNANKKMKFDEGGSYTYSLSVDYDADRILRQAAEEAGIGPHLFPWKTHMFINEDCLSLKCGYGNKTLYYYPVDGKWLITTLYGSDISKVIEYIKGGKPDFRVE